MISHIIWGGVEAASSSTSGDAPLSPAAAAAAEGRQQAKLGKQALPVKMQQYMQQGVDFRNESNTSSSPRHSLHVVSSESSPKALGGAATKARSPNAPVQECQPEGHETTELGEEDDEEEELGVEELIKQLMADEQLWSKGSARHSEGKCRPCHYFHTTAGCRSGRSCDFCHIPHTGKSRFRPGRSKRLQCKQIVSMLAEKYGQDVGKLESIMNTLASRSPYLRANFEERLKEIQDGSAREVPASAPPGADTPTRKHVVSL